MNSIVPLLCAIVTSEAREWIRVIFSLEIARIDPRDLNRAGPTVGERWGGLRIIDLSLQQNAFNSDLRGECA